MGAFGGTGEPFGRLDFRMRQRARSTCRMQREPKGESAGTVQPRGRSLNRRTQNQVEDVAHSMNKCEELGLKLR